MKFFTLFCFLLLTSTLSLINAQDNYIIEIDGKTYEISLDKKYEIDIDGKLVNVSVHEKDTLNYIDDMFSFYYPKDFKLSKLEIEEGIDQIMVMTAAGSGYMIQKYSTLNPSFLNEMMLTEVTKESVSYGYNLDRQDYTREIGSGQVLEVSKAVLTYLDETNVYEVASYGMKDRGVLIVTMDMGFFSEDGLNMIELMWNSFDLKEE